MSDVGPEYSDGIIKGIMASIAGLIGWTVKSIRRQARIEMKLTQLQTNQDTLVKEFNEKLGNLDDRVDKILNHITKSHLH